MKISEAEWAKRKAASAIRRKAARAAWKAAHREAINAAERMARIQRRDAAPAAATCEWCAAAFTTYGRNPGRDASRFCSRACGFDYQRTMRAVAKAARSERLCLEREAAAVVRREVAALYRIAKYKEKPRVFRHPCSQCGGLMTVRRNGGLHRVTCDDCKTDARWHGRQTYRAKRRAITRGATAEDINPIAVFTLADWHCAQCRKSTPRRLRGKPHPDAPELDHVIALAKGGTHTLGNVQLLCRACNQAKGAS